MRNYDDDDDEDDGQVDQDHDHEMQHLLLCGRASSRLMSPVSHVEVEAGALNQTVV